MLNALPVAFGRWGPLRSVPQTVALQAGCDDVAGDVASAILPSQEMLGRALEPRRFASSEAVTRSEGICVVAPHRKATIPAMLKLRRASGVPMALKG
jgi:NAD(P)H-dependent FMN reductase